ncbi:MAG: rubrerythrin family protein [Clostridia bacterium]|nr:rubrerythrin family protein [Clostridia bacterium]NCC74976.1 rubrerythrin family protein [Clostridia bacterium]
MLSQTIRDPHNRDILRQISDEEQKHYQTLKGLTGQDVRPNRFRVVFFYVIIRLFGLTFGVKLLEKGEENAVDVYSHLKVDHPQVAELVQDEESHEERLIEMIDEEKLNYIGSIVLGLNDALVELTGALAGFTFAFQNARLIAVTGLITGISASLSMASSEYLSTIQETGDRDRSLKSALYTGLAYVLTVVVLILPFLLLANPFISLSISLVAAVLIIFIFNYYISVAKDTPFRRRFLEMTLISLGVSGISFLIGMLVKTVFGIEV